MREPNGKANLRPGELRAALNSRSGIRQALLLAEVLAPPVAVQPRRGHQPVRRERPRDAN